jgi:hypothetical protein
MLTTGPDFSPHQFFEKCSKHFPQFFFFLTFLNINGDQKDSYSYYFIYLCLSTSTTISPHSKYILPL